VVFGNDQALLRGPCPPTALLQTPYARSIPG